MYLNYKEQGNQSLDNLISSLLKQLIQHEGAAFRSTKAKDLFQGVENEGRPTLDDFHEALYEEIAWYERVVIVVGDYYLFSATMPYSYCLWGTEARMDFILRRSADTKFQLDALDEATPEVAPRLVQQLQKLPKYKTSVLVTSQRTESERRVDLWDRCDVCGQSPLKVFFECNICHGGRFYICLECRGKEKYCEDERHNLIDRGKVIMNTEPTKNDIRLYVEAELNEELNLGNAEDVDGYASTFYTTPLGRLIKKNPNLKDEITDIVVEKSDGMFALAGLYMKSLRSLGLSEAQINDMLDHPPERYEFFYEQHMNRIISGFGDAGNHAADLGRRVLSWVACTKRPLSLSELQDALAMDLDKPDSFSQSAKYDRATIIRATAGLVTIDNPSELVRLNHQSAQQYFDENRDRWFQNVDAEITRTALHYLSLAQLSVPCQGEWEDKEFEERKRNYPFLVYAYQYWGDHAREAGSDSATRAAVTRFLSDSDAVASSTQAGWYLKSDTAADWDVRKGTNGLHISAWFGLTYAVTSLLDQEFDVDSRDVYGETPLMYASRRGQTATVAVLLNRGANVNDVSDRGGFPIFKTVDFNNVEVLKLLLARPDIDVNQANRLKSQFTALMLAIHKNHLENVIALLNQPKLDIAQRDINGGTALSHAIISSNPALATCILNHFGEDPTLLNSTNWVGESALILAAKNGQVVNVKQLLNKGADPSIKDSQGGGTALLRAVDGGCVSTVQLMLKYNAEVHCLHDKGRGLLHGATVGGQKAIVNLLLDKGLDPNVVDENGATPLHDASRCGQWAVAKTLLGAGADASLRDKADRTPWTVAWQNRHLSVMRVLEGKDHYERTESELLGQYPNASALPVWALALHGEKGLVAQAIKERSQEIFYINPDNDDTALHSAILSESPEAGQIEILKMLLQAGMAPDARNEYSRTPLHLAAMYGSVPITRLLLEAGNATVDLKDRWGTTSLLMAYADENKYLECALLLIDAGASIPATKQSMKQSLFFSAIEAGNLTAVINLVNMGADIQVKNVLGYTGLQMAKDGGKVNIEQYLRRNKSMKVPGIGKEEVIQEEDNEEEERLGALTLKESPFHRPEAWLEEEKDEKHEEERRTEKDFASEDDEVEEPTPLQQLKDLNVPAHSDGLRIMSMPNKGDISVGTGAVRSPRLAC